MLLTPHEQLIHAMAIGVRKQQFTRIRRHAVFDETLPPSDHEIADARAALAVVRDALAVVTPEMMKKFAIGEKPHDHFLSKAIFEAMIQASALTPDKQASHP